MIRTAVVLLSASLAVASAQGTGTSPQGGILAGMVRDTLGAPIPDVEVSVPDARKTTRTDATGKFTLPPIPAGVHEVSVRRIGYITVQFAWNSQTNGRVDIEVSMRMLPRTLDPVLIFANETKTLKAKSLVKGVVLESAGLPVAGADVQLVGTGRATVTHADGSFQFLHVAPGNLTVRARSIGYSPVVTRITLLDDDERQVFLKMHRLVTTLDTVRTRAESGYGPLEMAWKDLDARMRWRQEPGMSVVLGPERLAQMGSAPMDFWAKGLPYAEIGAVGGGPFGGTGGPGKRFEIKGDACILENGYRAVSRPIASYYAADIESIEYYPPVGDPPRPKAETEFTGTVATRMSHVAGCEGGFGNHPAYFVIWLKGSR